jgi:hypothetical protein
MFSLTFAIITPGAGQDLVMSEEVNTRRNGSRGPLQRSTAGTEYNPSRGAMD